MSRLRIASLALSAVTAALLLVVGLIYQATRASPELTSISGTRPLAFVATLPPGGGEICQDGTSIPAGSGALRIVAATNGLNGPRLTATLGAGNRDPVVVGALSRGWEEGPISIPLTLGASEARSSTGRLCIRSTGTSSVLLAGEADGKPARVDGKPASGRVSLIASSKNSSSLGRRLSALPSRIGRGNAAWVGPWAAYAVAGCVLIAVLLGATAVRVTGVPNTTSQAGRAIVAAALALGVAWALLIPPFQVPDETSHVAYVEYLRTSGELPQNDPSLPPFSEEQNAVLGALDFARVIGRPLETVNTSRDSEALLRRIESLPFEGPTGNATTASANPPFYYLLQTPAALAGSQGTLLTRVALMRLVSVLLFAATVGFVYLFARELVPSSPWAWTAAGLAACFQPLLGFIGSGVNADGLVFLTGSAVFFLVARILNRGLTPKLGTILGATVAAGLLTKPLFVALVPVALLGVIIAAARRPPNWSRSLVYTLVSVAIPLTVVIAVGNAIFDHPYFAVTASVVSTQASETAQPSSLARQASFMLQLFAPRFPFLDDQIAGVAPRDIWISGLVGRFGWVDYGFGSSAITVGWYAFLAVVTTVVAAVVRFRVAIKQRWGLCLCCLAGLVAVPGAIGVVDYQAFLAGAPRFEQSRYLLPLITLYGGAIAITIRLFGSRIAPFLVIFLLAAVTFHTASAMLLTVDRYYV